MVRNKVEAVEEEFKDLGQVSKELYRWLRLKTECEATLVVLAEEDEGDGIKMGIFTCKIQQKNHVKVVEVAAI